MKLVNLELIGFKSFAEKTRIHFDEFVTAVVGPNGCGKSNIADAIRWGLGEQSAKTMRVSKMQDLIFNGSEVRKPSNFASVSLTFENDKGILPPEYSVLTITRKLYRDGTSEYYINGVPSLLKDIQQLLSKAGLGPNSYAVIELAMIEELLRDNNKSRRTLFESAAGIAQYKIRKKEALQNLNETEKNLLRLSDILLEVEEQLKLAEKEAKQAKNYLELKEQYKQTSILFSRVKVFQIQEQQAKIQEKIRELQDRKSAAETRKSKHAAKISELKKQLIDIEKEIRTTNENYTQFLETISQIDTERKVLLQKIQILEQEQKQLHQRLQKNIDEENLENQIKILEDKIDEKLEKLEDLEFRFENLDEIREELLLAKQNSEKKLKKISVELQELLREYNKKEREYHQIQTRLEVLKETLQNQTQDTQYDLLIKGLQQKISELRELLENKEKELKKQREFHKEISLKIEELQAENKEIQEKLSSLEHRIKQTESRRELLKKLLENLDGFPKGIRFVRKKLLPEAPLLGEILEVQEEYKTAVENFLQPHLNHFIVEDLQTAWGLAEALQQAKQGKINCFVLELLPDNSPESKEIEGLIPLQKIVKLPEKYHKLSLFLLRNAYVLQQEKTPENLPDNIALLHPKGKWTLRPPELHGGEITLFEGKSLGTKKELEKTQAELKNLHAQKLSLVEKQKELQQKIQELQEKLPDFSHLEEEHQKLLQEKNQAETQLNAYKNISSQKSLEEEKQIKQTQSLEKQLRKILPVLDDLANKIEELENEKERLENVFKQKEKELEDINKEYNQLLLQIQQEQNTVKHLKEQLKFLRKTKENYSTEQEKHKKRLQELEEEIRKLQEQAEEKEKELAELYEIKEIRYKKYQEQLDKLENLRERIRNNEEFLRKEENLVKNLEEEIAKLKQEIVTLSIEIQSAIERLKIEFDLNLEELQNEVSPEELKKQNLTQLERKTQRLRSRIQGFGPVNLRAIDTYNQIKERYDSILQQKNDILEAKQNLIETIQALDAKATEEFMKAFTQIREHFKRVFQTLFREGDTCDLVLQNPEEPLTSKILIKAKPKGKRPVSIEQLSGGEKTLTATALLFAIYLYKPSPFCLFDEVDAPLDDANVDKFNNIIKEFSKNTQFILITHNKRTMLYAHKLYGVSMPEIGVSTALPLSISELNLAE